MNRTFSFCRQALLLLALLFAAPRLPGQAQSGSDSARQETGPGGKWIGILDVRAAQLQLNVELEKKENGTWAGMLFSVDQGNAPIPVSSMTVDGDEISIEMTSVGANFRGKLDSDGNRIRGKFEQNGSHLLELFRVHDFDDPEHVETWRGTMSAGGKKFDFGLRVFEVDSGLRWGRFDSYSESVSGFFASLSPNGKEFGFSVNAISASFDGTVSADGKSITGTWKQPGGEFPLALTQGELGDIPRAKRPQTPVEPFPYTSEDVRFDNSAARGSLAGTLTIPKGTGPWPAVILISGSGPQDRDATIFGHKIFLVMADHLSRQGIAVLRYDERGVGESTGNFGTATSMDFASDVRAAIEYLKSRQEIRPDRIGLIGHSEGGLIAPLVAADNADVAAVVLLAGPGVNGQEILASQLVASLKAAGVEEETLDAVDRLVRRMNVEILKSPAQVSREAMDALWTEVTTGITDAKRLETMSTIRSVVASMESPWLEFFFRHEPAPVLAMVQCPLLVLNGKKDLQVLCDLNVNSIEKALKDAEHRDFEIHRLDRLNHLFQETDGPGLGSEYGVIEQTFAPSALKLMSDWLRSRLD